MPQNQPAEAHRQKATPAGAQEATLRIDDFLPYRLHLVAGLASQALSQVYTERHRLSVAEWRVLVALSEHGRMTGTALGVRTYMHKTKVSRAVSQLEQRGFLDRRSNSADMRESHLSLTPAGQAIYNEIAPHALELEEQLAQAINPADRAAFERSIDQLVARARGLLTQKHQRHDAAKAAGTEDEA